MIAIINDLGLQVITLNFPAQLFNGTDDLLIPDNNEITDSAFEKQEPISVLKKISPVRSQRFTIKFNKRLSVTPTDTLLQATYQNKSTPLPVLPVCTGRMRTSVWSIGRPADA